MSNSFNAKRNLNTPSGTYTYYALDALGSHVAQLPFSIKILLENALRHEDGHAVRREDVERIANWRETFRQDLEIPFSPSRVLMQDFTGVPALVDLAAMREAMAVLGGDQKKINPLVPAELVIDHSVQVDVFGTPDAVARNAAIEFERNQERYAFLKWGQKAFHNFAVVPPDTGIVHQVNLEYLARVVFRSNQGVIYPDTLVGTDSHTTMINGLGVLGWGVGGIEAEAAMLGQPIAMVLPPVVGMHLHGRLQEGVTATDLVLTITEKLRRHGVVGKFVEFFGDGLASLPLADRATIANMAPEYGATCGLFPIDQETLNYLHLTGRTPDHIALVEQYARQQGLWGQGQEPAYAERLDLDLASIVPSVAGPRRPQDRIALPDLKPSISQTLQQTGAERAQRDGREVGLRKVPFTFNGQEAILGDGDVVIAAITSCTNTSNPAVLVGAGLLARKARQAGLSVKPWIKTSLAPGSLAVRSYLQAMGLDEDLAALGFDFVGFGCTTCIGNSGPLPEEVSSAIGQEALVVSAVLSGNRNFEGRIHPEVRMNFLASPPLVVAFALAGSVLIDFTSEPIGRGSNGQPVFLRDIWPSNREIQDLIGEKLTQEMFTENYAHVFEGDVHWRNLAVPEHDTYVWDERSTYIKRPPYFDGMSMTPAPVRPIVGARVLAYLGDSVTTDHISPAGSIKKDSPAGQYLMAQGVAPKDFNSYGSRRGNHEVMIRGTFANVRLRNRLAGDREGGLTSHMPSGELMTIYDAAMRYQQEGIPLMVLAGKEYGTGSSRDWAAKGTALLGVRAVLAESYERIHRSNLVGMGVLPLAFLPGESAESLGLQGTERYTIEDLAHGVQQVRITVDDGASKRTISARVRIDTPKEWDYFAHGGILPYALRMLAAS
jgi:aconitate hydratase